MSPNKKSRHLAADGALLFASVIWGSTFFLVKQSLQYTTPFYFMTLRFAIAFVLISLFYNRRLAGLTRDELRGGVLTGITLFLGFAFQTWGLVYTSAGKSAFITGLNVILVPFLLWGMGRTRIRARRWWAAALATLGLFLLTNPTGSAGTNRGDWLTLFCAVAFAGQIILLGIYSPRTNIGRYFWVQLLTVIVLGLGATTLVDGWRLIAAPTLWLGLGITGVGGTAVAFLGMTWAQKYASPTRTALILTSEPVFGALFAAYFAGELLSRMGWLGGAIIVVVIVWSELGDPPARPVSSESD